MDRSYWRGEPNKRLIEEARTKGCELCRVLSERVEDLGHRIAEDVSEAEDRAIEIDDAIYDLRREVEMLELMISQRDDRIEELEAQLGELK
jgi:tRNA U54 and U55 pseudouridine synthase Pus10